MLFAASAGNRFEIIVVGRAMKSASASRAARGSTVRSPDPHFVARRRRRDAADRGQIGSVAQELRSGRVQIRNTLV